MPRPVFTRVVVDLGRLRANAEQIAASTGKPLIGVVKADAYGAGAGRVAGVLHDLVRAWYVLRSDEAYAANLPAFGKPTIVALPSPGEIASDLHTLGIRPAVWTEQMASHFRLARPVLCVDTGMQRFACPPTQIAAVARAGACDEAYTHATNVAQVRAFAAATEGMGLFRHAAASSLLDSPECRLDAVRPGAALHRGAMSVLTPMIEVRDATGPVGYGGFDAARFGVIRVGYSDGLRPGPCIINGRRTRVIEVGMQTSYVECVASDDAGDDVVLLSPDLPPEEVALAWRCSPQNAQLHLARAGRRVYVGP